jgi:hypothetical protein
MTGTIHSIVKRRPREVAPRGASAPSSVPKLLMDFLMTGGI